MNVKRMTIKLFWCLCFIFSLQIGTQVYAYLQSYVATLGYFYIMYESIPIYYPHAFLAWGYTYGFEYYSSLAFLFSIIASSFICGLMLKTKKESNIHGSAKWMNFKTLKKTGVLDKPHGVVLGQTYDAKFKAKVGKKVPTNLKTGQLIVEDDAPHTLVIGPTGHGKGISTVEPTLFSWRESVIVYDTKKENWIDTSGYRARFSIPIRFEPASKTSMKWNPLFEIPKGDREIAISQEISEIVCFDDPDDPSHWIKQARILLLSLILYLTNCEHPHPVSFRGVLSLMSEEIDQHSEFEGINQLFDKMSRVLIPHNSSSQKIIRETGIQFLKKDDREMASIASSLIAFMGIYNDPIVAENTNTSDFSVMETVTNDLPVSIYHVVSPNDQGRMKPLTRLFYSLASSRIQESLYNKKHKVLFLIDEFPSLGKLDFIEKGLAVWRGYGIRGVLICQSFQQLFSIYGQHTSLPDNCDVKIILGANSVADSELISKYLGDATVEKDSESRSGQVAAMLLRNKSISTSETGRALFTPEEVRNKPYEELIILRSGYSPYLGKKVFCFSDFRFKNLLNLKTLEQANCEDIVKRKLPYLRATRPDLFEEKQEGTPEEDPEKKQDEKTKITPEGKTEVNEKSHTVDSNDFENMNKKQKKISIRIHG